MKEDKLDKALRIESELPSSDIEYAWAVPVKEFCEAFGLTDSGVDECRHCGKPTKPFLPFWFKTDRGETVVGVVHDHLDCANVNGSCCNPTTMVHIDEDSEFNKSVKGLFELYAG